MFVIFLFARLVNTIKWRQQNCSSSSVRCVMLPMCFDLFLPLQCHSATIVSIRLLHARRTCYSVSDLTARGRRKRPRSVAWEVPFVWKTLSVSTLIALKTTNWQPQCYIPARASRGCCVRTCFWRLLLWSESSVHECLCDAVRLWDCVLIEFAVFPIRIIINY